MSTLSRRHGWRVLQSDAMACTCPVKNPMHTSGWRCVQPAQLEAWRTAEPMAQHVTDPQRAKLLCWLWIQYSQDPKAKALSGRA